MRTASKLGIILSAISPVLAAMGAIDVAGDVKPASPALWTGSTLLRVGENSFGAVTGKDAVLSTGSLHLGDGYLELQNSGADNGLTAVGVRASLRGQLTLASSTLTTSLFDVGCGGEGLVLASNATINSTWASIGDSSWGLVAVSGTNSRLESTESLTVGAEGQGSLSVVLGAKASSRYATIGQSASGKVVIDGTGSTWTNAQTLAIGEGGTGSLEILAGGSVSSASATIGNSARGDVSVTGPGSQWVNNGSLDLRSGSLLVSDGARVTSSSGRAAGDVTITGPGSSWSTGQIDFVDAGQLIVDNGASLTSGAITIGVAGSGTMRFANGAQVTTAAVTVGSGGRAEITGAESQWHLSGDLTVNSFGPNGGLLVSDGSVTTKNLIAPRNALQGNGSITATGAFIAADFLFDTTHRPEQAITVPFGSGGTVHLNLNSTSILGVDNGSITIRDGVVLTTTKGILGAGADSRATLSVTGNGSRWNTGTLIAAAGADLSVTVADGAAVNTNTFMGSLSNIKGSGVISATGVVLDDAIVLDSPTATLSEMAFGSGGKLQINGMNVLGVGYSSTGTLEVSGGAVVNSSQGLIGAFTGGRGLAVVSGEGTKWNVGELTIGTSPPDTGRGNLSIREGAQVTSTIANLRAGEILVAGAGSKLTSTDIEGGGLRIENGGEVSYTRSIKATGSPIVVAAGGNLSGGNGKVGLVGTPGKVIVTGAGALWDATYQRNPTIAVTNGILAISDGGRARTGDLTLDPAGSVQLNVSGDDMIVLGGGFGLLNQSTIRVLADAYLPAGVYRPISNGAGGKVFLWGSGVVQASGGTWDKTSQLFSVAPATKLNSGDVATIATGRRLLYEDAQSNQRLGVSFGALTGTPQFTAIAMGDDPLASLAGAGTILSAWNFNTTLSGAEVLLSFELDPGLDVSKLQAYHYDGGSWATFNMTDLSFDSKGIASFTANSFSGYAMVLVPEPMLVMLPAWVSVGLLSRRRQTSRQERKPEPRSQRNHAISEP